MDRHSVRINRFNEQSSFEAVLDLLVALRPELPREVYRAALARLPCLVTHDADRHAALALKGALERRGASVTLLEPDADRSDTGVSKTVELSPEIDLAFLTQSRLRAPTAKPTRADRGERQVARSDRSASRDASSDGTAPWDD